MCAKTNSGVMGPYFPRQDLQAHRNAKKDFISCSVLKWNRISCEIQIQNAQNSLKET